ncbi:MAG: zinc metalloprotease HtpX [Candidatus Omnitrophota bacterium]
MNNTAKTVVLLTCLSALLMSIGGLIGGRAGMMFALFMSFAINFGAYWFSDKMVLAMHKAKPIHQGDASGVYDIVRELSSVARLPMPVVYLIPGQLPNAFATGRNPQNAAVAVTEGLTQLLSRKELRGVIAHELSHIGNRDILIATIAPTMASAIMYLAHMLQCSAMMGGGRGERDDHRGINPIAMLATIILAPVAATLIQAAVSRSREFIADDSGARMAQDPDSLASALEKISNPRMAASRQNDSAPSGAQSAFAHMYIVNHLKGETVMNLFSTHPPANERIRRLRSMKGINPCAG